MTHEENMCPIYECVMDKYENRICSTCEKLPCDNYYKCSDPCLTTNENKIDIENRVKLLKLI
jgi:hypothetical protein